MTPNQLHVAEKLCNHDNLEVNDEMFITNILIRNSELNSEESLKLKDLEEKYYGYGFE